MNTRHSALDCFFFSASFPVAIATTVISFEVLAAVMPQIGPSGCVPVRSMIQKIQVKRILLSSEKKGVESRIRWFIQAGFMQGNHSN